MLRRLFDFQKNSFLCDTIIVSKTLTEFKVHSVILAALSHIFEDAFKSAPVFGLYYINLPSVDDETILALINSIYSGKIILPKLPDIQKFKEIKANLKLLGIDDNSFDKIFDKKTDKLLKKYLCKNCKFQFDSLLDLTDHNCQESNSSDDDADINYSTNKLKFQFQTKIKNDNVSNEFVFNTGVKSEKQPFSLTKNSCRPIVSVENSINKDMILPHNSSFTPSSKENISNKICCNSENFSLSKLTSKNNINNIQFKLLRNIKRKSNHNKHIINTNLKNSQITSKINESSDLNDGLLNVNNSKNQDGILNNFNITFPEHESEFKYINESEWIYKSAEQNTHKSGKEIVICELCGLGLKKYSIRNHMETMHQRNDSKYPCSECDKIFHTGHRRHMHVVREHKKDPQGHLCELCGRHFNNSTSIYYHMYKHKKEEEEEVIKKMVKAEIKVKKEITKKKKKSSLQCQYCQEIFNKSSILRQHINRMHIDIVEKLDLPFKCDYCDKEFDYKSQYVTHIAIHKDDRSFVCPHCGKGFKNRVGIHYHLRIHSSVKRFICKECGQGFKLSHHLKQHMAHHTSLKPFKCDICEKAYKAKSDLKNHLKHCHQIDSAKNFIEITRELKLLEYITDQDINNQNILDDF